MFEKSLTRFKKFQTIIDELHGKYVLALMNKYLAFDHFTSGAKFEKSRSELKALHINHAALAEVFKSIIDSSNSPVL